VRTRILFRRAGFTLIELMVALALAAMISVAIMVISNQAQEVYETTSRKVDVYNKFRYALLAVERDFSQWIATPNLEFFVDGKGTGTRNENWDPGEELQDIKDKAGPGVIDGGLFKEYDEFAYVIERHYKGTERTEGTGEVSKIHDAFQVYYRTVCFIDGRPREANVEYKLLDPGNPDSFGNPQPPVDVPPERMNQLALYKVIRYHDISYDEILKPNENFHIVRKFVEVATNITDFRIEYTVDNRYEFQDPSRGGNGFRTPSEDYQKPVEPMTRPDLISGTEGFPGGPVYLKRFGYGTMNINASKKWPTANGFPALFGDRRTVGGEHRPVRFGWQANPDIKFCELSQGDSIYIFTDLVRGAAQVAGAGWGVAGGSGLLSRFPAGVYHIRTNRSGMLEFLEDVDSTTWGTSNITNVRYKAAYLPEAIRITMRVINDMPVPEARTMQRIVWIRQKSR
jgi:prepilin-type N-terminal cleavage/methylation domain-containing protein